MAKFPYMPLFWDALMLDTGHLSDAEFGLYVRVLGRLWLAPRQRLPNDDVWLARRFGRDQDWVSGTLRPILLEFCQCDGNWISQKRLSVEFDRAMSRRHQQSVRSKARWHNGKDSSHGNPNHNHSKKKNTDTGISSSLESSESSLTPTIAHSRKTNEREIQKSFEEFWNVCPRKVGKGAARRAFATALKKTDLATLVAAMARYAKLRSGGDPTFTAHPATWLNGERWSDESAPVNGSAMPGPDLHELQRLEDAAWKARRTNGGLQ